MGTKHNGWADVHIRDGAMEGWFGEGVGGIDGYPLATLVLHVGDNREPVYTRSEIEQLIKTLRMAFNVIDEMNAEGFGPLTSKEGLDAFNSLVDALQVFDPS